MNVKIYGAGSIGNHHAHAARSLGWDVTVCDIAQQQLTRMKKEIYPERYGIWDSKIKLRNVKDGDNENYDLIIIGTPPDTHLSIFEGIIKSKPRSILIEKPLCSPFSNNMNKLFKEANHQKISTFIGYDHVVSASVEHVEEIFIEGNLGEIITIDVEFRESWDGIFAAHPWLAGPHESYLGYIERGGGSLCEHSHALNLWQHFTIMAGGGKVNKVNSIIKLHDDGKTKYDSIALLNLESENGIIGRVVQDVLSLPVKKQARLQGSKGIVTIDFGYEGKGDLVRFYNLLGELKIEKLHEKNRPDDFIRELSHIKNFLEDNSNSPIKLERGIETMHVINETLGENLPNYN